MLTWLWKRLSESGARVTISGRALGRFPASDVERLLRAQVLVEQQKADAWSVCAHCDCGLDARPVEQLDDVFRACCPHDQAEDVILQKDDLRRFSVDADRLVSRLVVGSDLGGVVASVSDGIWLLGETRSGHAAVLCVDADNLATPGAVMAIKAAVGQKPVVLIASNLSAEIAVRLRESGIEPREFSPCFMRMSNGGERFALEAQSSEPRLVLKLSAQLVTLDGRRLDLPTQMFALFRLLIEQSVNRDPVLKNQDIERQTGRPPNQIIRDLRSTLVT